MFFGYTCNNSIRYMNFVFEGSHNFSEYFIHIYIGFAVSCKSDNDGTETNHNIIKVTLLGKLRTITFESHAYNFIKRS